MTLLRRIIIIWMMAVTIHFPVPVCDGDNLRSWESPGSGTASPTIDIDVILLGCALPDDVDDGPVDDDPGDDMDSSFGDYFASLGARGSHRDHELTVHPVWSGFVPLLIDSGMDVCPPLLRRVLISLGKTSRDRQAVLRC